MLLTEYNEKLHLKNTFLEGRKEGLERGLERGRKEGLETGLKRGLETGRQDKLKELVQKKLAKGKSIPEIAAELEEEISVIEQILAADRG